MAILDERESCSAPKRNRCFIYQMVGLHNCFVIIVAHEAAVPTELVIVIHCHNAIVCTCSQKAGAE